MKRWLILGFLCAMAFGQQVNNDIIPASPGLNIGHSNQAFNGYFQNITIYGTCTFQGQPCLNAGIVGATSGGGLTVIGNTLGLNLCPNGQTQVSNSLTYGCGTVGGSSAGLQFDLQSANNSNGFDNIPAPTTACTNLVLYNVVTTGTKVKASSACPSYTGRAVTGTTNTDTILFSDNVLPVKYQGSVAVSVSLPTQTTLGISGFAVELINNTSGSSTAVTVTAAGSLHFNTTGTSTLVIAQGQVCKIETDPGGGWDADCHDLPMIQGSGVTITRGQYGPTIATTGGGASPFLYQEAAVSPATSNSNNSNPVNIYTGYTVPGGTLTSGHSLDIKFVFKHTGGTSASYTFTFGGQTVTLVSGQTGANNTTWDCTIWATGAATQTVTCEGNSPAGGGLQSFEGLTTVTLSGSAAINLTETTAGTSDVFTAYGMRVVLY